MTNTPRIILSWNGESIVLGHDRLIALPECHWHCAPEWRDGPRVRLGGVLECEAVIDAATQAELIDRLEEAAPAMPRLRYEDDPRDGDISWVGLFEEANLRGGRLHLRGILRWPWPARRRVCRDLALLAEGLAFGAPTGSWLSVVFGFNRGIPSVPLFPVSSVPTESVVTESATEIPLRTRPDWPATGRVQIGDEVLEYGLLAPSPPRLQNLTRATPRHHARGQACWLIPPSPIRWVVADHEAGVVALRADRFDGPLVEMTVEQEELSGRTATMAASDSLPVVVEHASWPITVAPPAEAGDWTLALATTTALDPGLAFAESVDGRGARLLLGAGVLRANWNGGEGFSARRHDLLVGGRLRLEWSSSGFWGTDTRLRLQIVKGGASATFLLGDSVPQQILSEVTGVALLPGVPGRSVSNGAAVVPEMLADFDRVHPDSLGDWQDAAKALLPLEAGHATWDHDDDPVVAGPLRLGVLREQTGWGGAVRGVGLFAVLRCEPPQDVLLRVSVPGRVTRLVVAEAGAEWGTFGEIVEDLNFAPEELLSGDCIFEIEPTAPGRVEVGAAWLRLRPEAPKLVVVDEAPPAGTAPLEAAVRSSAPFLPLHLEVTPLLDPEGAWGFFETSDTPITMTVELINPTTGLEVRVRRLRWEVDVHPATRVAASPRLFGDVEGRALSPLDGQCDPVEVVRELGTDAMLGSVPPHEWLDDGISAALAATGRRFRAVVRDGRTLDDAMERALGEAGLLVDPTRGDWRVVFPGGDPAEVAPEAILDHLPALRVRRPVIEAGRVVLLRDDAEPWRHVVVLDPGTGGTETGTMQWLSSGWESLADLVAGFAGTAWRGALPLAPGGDFPPLGEQVVADTSTAYPWPSARGVRTHRWTGGVRVIEVG